jgi:nicotinamide mononucleotide transporter
MMNEIFILGQGTSWLEIAAMLTGVWAVWLTAKQNILCFPVGILNVVLYAFLFFSPGVRLYADALLQCIYVILLIYGWKKWSGKQNEETVSEKTDSKSAARLFLLCFSGTILLGYFFDKYTDAAYPWLDSALTSLSLAAQWMVAKKFIENWIVWIAVDIVYVPLFIVKHLPLTAILYLFFLVLAVIGWIAWKKKSKHSVYS